MVFSYADGAVRGPGLPRPTATPALGQRKSATSAKRGTSSAGGWMSGSRPLELPFALGTTFQSFDRYSFGKIIRHYATPATACSTCI